MQRTQSGNEHSTFKGQKYENKATSLESSFLCHILERRFSLWACHISEIREKHSKAPWLRERGWQVFAYTQTCL